MKLRHQPRHKDHPAYRKSKGSVATESHLYLSPDASGAGCHDYKSGMRQSPGSARRGRDVNPASRHSKRPKQEGSNICPSKDKLRSQPGWKDHQAFKYPLACFGGTILSKLLSQPQKNWGFSFDVNSILILLNYSNCISTGFIRPCLEYCSHIWGTSPYTSLLDRVESKAIRLIGDLSLTSTLDPLSLRRKVA